MGSWRDVLELRMGNYEWEILEGAGEDDCATFAKERRRRGSNLAWAGIETPLGHVTFSGFSFSGEEAWRFSFHPRTGLSLREVC